MDETFLFLFPFKLNGMTLPPSNLTNSITNLLHACFLLGYTLGSYLHWVRGNKNVQLGVVAFFGLMCMLKVGGVYVHFAHRGYPLSHDVLLVWFALGTGVVALNTLIAFLLRIPSLVRTLIVAVSIGLYIMFVISSYRMEFYDINFTYFAVSLIVTYLVAAIYSSRLLRLGWVLVIVSNFAWIGMDSLFDWAGYQNDIYHFSLIVSTFVIYRSVTKGYWEYPHNSIHCDSLRLNKPISQQNIDSNGNFPARSSD